MSETERRWMRLPYNPNYPDFDEVHREDDWCGRAGCVPVCDQNVTLNYRTHDDANEVEHRKRLAMGTPPAASTGTPELRCACGTCTQANFTAKRFMPCECCGAGNGNHKVDCSYFWKRQPVPAEDDWITQKAVEEDGALVLAGKLASATSEPGESAEPPTQVQILAQNCADHSNEAARFALQIIDLRAQLQEREREIAEARSTAATCDDVALNRPLSSIINQLQIHREDLEGRLAERDTRIQRLRERLKHISFVLTGNDAVLERATPQEVDKILNDSK